MIIVTMWLLFMSLCARYAVAAPAADRVAELPDYGTPPTPQYSGFLKAVVFLLMPMIKISRPPIFYLLHWLYHFHDFEILLFIIISVCWHFISYYLIYLCLLAFGNFVWCRVQERTCTTGLRRQATRRRISKLLLCYG